MGKFKEIYDAGTAEITVKKSRFIAYVKTVYTPEEAEEFVESIRKKNYDARHNCWAYITGTAAEDKRFSDDGEPAGTAGKPIMSVIEGAELTNCCVVVTRYFGGVLLGTGGLVRAYTDAAREAVSASKAAVRVSARDLIVQCDYGFMGKLQYLAAEQEIPVMRTDYGDTVRTELLVDEEIAGGFIKKLTDLSGGKADIRDIGGCSYYTAEGRTVKLR